MPAHTAQGAATAIEDAAIFARLDDVEGDIEAAFSGIDLGRRDERDHCSD